MCAQHGRTPVPDSGLGGGWFLFLANLGRVQQGVELLGDLGLDAGLEGTHQKAQLGPELELVAQHLEAGLREHSVDWDMLQPVWLEDARRERAREGER